MNFRSSNYFSGIFYNSQKVLFPGWSTHAVFAEYTRFSWGCLLCATSGRPGLFPARDTCRVSTVSPKGVSKAFRGGFRDTWHPPKVSEGGSDGGLEGGIRQGFGMAPKGFIGRASRTRVILRKAPKGVFRGGTSRRGFR